MKAYVSVRPDPELVAESARDWLVGRIQQRVRDSERCVIALAGGSTPKRLYELLAELPEGTIPWDKVHLIWGDERNVPLTHEDSNFAMVCKAMLNHLGKRGPNVYPVPIEVEQPDQVASRYEATLKALLGAPDQRWPSVDVALLGLGEDAHTASIFPGTDVIAEKTRWVSSCYVPKLGCYRITLTAPIFNHAKAVAFLVCGESKRQALQQVWHAAHNPRDYPAQLIRPSEEIWWMLDQAALDSIELPSGASLAQI